MGRYIEISKQSQILNEHYYKVTPHDHPEIKPFYIGLNETTKKVFFYEEINKEPFTTINFDGNLQYRSSAAKNRIPRWLIFLCLKKAMAVFLDGNFPSNISFQS